VNEKMFSFIGVSKLQVRSKLQGEYAIAYHISSEVQLHISESGSVAGCLSSVG